METLQGSDEKSDASTWVVIGVGLFIAAAGFAFHLNLELRLDKLEVFNQNNILFDADPNEVLPSFFHGKGPNEDFRRGLIHPNLGNFFTVPIRGLANTASLVFPGEIDPTHFRRQLALLVVPISAALFYLVFYALLLHLRFPLLLASLFTVLALFTFSQMLFGSIPETYALSNFAIALAYLLFVLMRGRSGMYVFPAWFAVGMFTTGITITNIIPVMILFWLGEIYKGCRISHSLLRTSGLAALVLVVTILFNLMSNFAVGFQQRSLGKEAGWVKAFIPEDINVVKRKFLTFPTILVNSVVAQEPKQVHNEYAVSMDPAARYDFQFTYDYDNQEKSTLPFLSFRNSIGIVLCLLILLLVLRVLPVTDPTLYLLSWGSLLIIGYNWVLHSFWGLDRMLYSQHWHVSLMLLLAAIVAPSLHASRVRTALVAASILLIAANNLLVLRTMLKAF